jgi:hypothetical protein
MRRALILLALAGCGTKVVDLAPLDAGSEKVAACVVQILSDDVRCLYCKGTANEQVACLKCETLDPAAAQCRMCVWSDNPKLVCKLCVDATGKPSSPDDCDRLRPELSP